MTMYSFNLILDLCLLGHSILLFTATDILRQCPCTSASIIFFTCAPKLRFAGLQLCLALQSSHCHHRFTSLPAVGIALLPAVGTALLLAVGTALFTDSWVPTLAFFFSGHHSNFATLNFVVHDSSQLLTCTVYSRSS